MRVKHLLVVALIFAPGLVSAQTGYAHGRDHCYHFQTPSGWQMDNRVGAANGVPMVFFPEGTTWQSAEVAMYTRPSPQLRPGPEAIKAQVNDVIAMYRAASENVVAVPSEQVQAKGGARGELWSYSGYRNGGSELAIYFVGRNTVNYFVAQVPRGADQAQAKQALLALASSYREATDCKPCSEAACKH